MEGHVWFRRLVLRGAVAQQDTETVGPTSLRFGT